MRANWVILVADFDEISHIRREFQHRIWSLKNEISRSETSSLHSHKRQSDARFQEGRIKMQ